MSGSFQVDFGENVPGETVSATIGTTDATGYLLRKKKTVFAAGSVPSGGRAVLPSSYASGTELTVCNRSANALTVSATSNQIESYGSTVAVAPGGNSTFTSFDPPASPPPRTWWLTALLLLLFAATAQAQTMTGNLLVQNNLSEIAAGGSGAQAAARSNLGVGALPTGANPTATAGATVVNGSATTYMRSDAAPAVAKAGSSTFGIMEPDGTTQTVSGGVVSTAPTTINGTSCTPGSTCTSPGIGPAWISSGVFTNTQMNIPFSFLVNGIDPTTEFAATQGDVNHATQALVGGVLISSGSTVSQAGGLASYVQNSSTATNGVGLFINCRGIATGVQCFGINESLTDVNGASNYALDALIGNETDIECANLSTACVGYNMIGVFPNGSPGRFGYAYQASALGSNSPWQVAFKSATGGALVGLGLDPLSSGASQSSQPVFMNSSDASSAIHLCSIQNVTHASTGTLNLVCQTSGDSITISSPLSVFASANVGGELSAAVSTAGAALSLGNTAGICTHTPGASSETVACSSDVKFKRDVTAAPFFSGWLWDLPVRQFTLKSTGQRVVGVVAQELRKTHPEMVHENSAPDGSTYLSVDQPNPWRMVKAIQELQAFAAAVCLIAFLSVLLHAWHFWRHHKMPR